MCEKRVLIVPKALVGTDMCMSCQFQVGACQEGSGRRTGPNKSRDDREAVDIRIEQLSAGEKY